MHRTQVYLDEPQYRALQSRARREGKTMAAVLRDILDQHFALGGAPTTSADPFCESIGIGEGDGAPVAEHVDDYLYGGRE